jgi:hypothetical protein
MTRRKHSPMNELILFGLDLSMFPIERVITPTEKFWQVTDLRAGRTNGDVRKFPTRFDAELAICSVVRYAMEGN